MPDLLASMVQVHPFRMRGDTIEYLLLRRSPEEIYCPGIWQVITGEIEPGESSLDAARRELFEETGFLAETWFALPQVAMFYFEPRDQVILSPVFAAALLAESEPTLSEEHVEHCWLPLAEASARLFHLTHRQGARWSEEIITSTFDNERHSHPPG